MPVEKYANLFLSITLFSSHFHPFSHSFPFFCSYFHIESFCFAPSLVHARDNVKQVAKCVCMLKWIRKIWINWMNWNGWSRNVGRCAFLICTCIKCIAMVLFFIPNFLMQPILLICQTFYLAFIRSYKS